MTSREQYRAFLCSLLFTVVYSASSAVRLVGNSDVSGRLEYLYSGQWGTVCDDHFDMLDATVVCRELNLGNAVKVLTGVGVAWDSSPIWLDDVRCTGEEQRLIACPSTSPHNCTHSEDVGVECTGDLNPVRLVSVWLSANEGNVEVQHDGVWGSICDDSWSGESTRVVCKQLGFEGGSNFFGQDYTDSTAIILDDVDCVGTEQSIGQCPHRNWGEHDCNNNEKVWVSCYTYDSLLYGSVRLVGGIKTSRGILEVNIDGRWGTVCGESWGKDEAQVVCRQLGYKGVEEYRQSRYLYQIGNTESHPINIQTVDCTKELSKITYCTISTDSWGSCGQDHTSDVALSCIPSEDDPVDGELRLVGGTDSEGILEIFVDYEWRTICDNYWYQDEGDAACKQLGYDYASDYSAYTNGFDTSQASQLQIYDSTFDCYLGTETSLSECTQSYYGTCGYDFVALKCSYNSGAGAILGAIVVIIIVIIIVVVCCFRRRRRMNGTSRTTTTSIPFAANHPIQVHPPVQQPLIPQPGQPHLTQPGYPYQHGQGYPPQTGQGYPAQPGYPPQPGQGYPSQPDQGYPPQTGQWYPLQGQGYPPQPGQVYPPQPGQDYPPQPGQVYPPQSGQVYPPQPGQVYPIEPTTAYPSQPNPGYPPQTGQAYPPQPGQAYPPQPDQGYPSHPELTVVQQGAPYPVANDPAYPVQPSAPQPEPADLPPKYDVAVQGPNV
ncbi:neurotrypsin-like [Anneissia japonica]|uniref:neurotrypsin-like n=1 Tax=Anneissia japonica TaxID=1529436 RepID=UPI0014257FAD|nr:neurotrypsin-like [Anneissia japonica]XP_033115362.1 neurotrypsin-like [Anneissia japonica]